MIKKIALVTFAATLLMTSVVSAASANPFADVPKGHWAYESLAKLKQGNVLPAGKDYDGNKIITRYEMALRLRSLDITAAARNALAESLRAPA